MLRCRLSLFNLMSIAVENHDALEQRAIFASQEDDGESDVRIRTEAATHTSRAVMKATAQVD